MGTTFEWLVEAIDIFLGKSISLLYQNY